MVVGLEKGLVVTKEERDEGVRHKIIGFDAKSSTALSKC